MVGAGSVCEGVPFIGLDRECHLGFGLGRIGYHHAGDQRLDEVVDMPGSGGRLEDDLIGGVEVTRGPYGKLIQPNSAGCNTTRRWVSSAPIMT